MSSFNRERFLFWLLASVLAVNAAFFGIALVRCGQFPNPQEICPNIGKRFDTFSERTLAAVLGLIAGSAAVGAAVSRRKADNEEPANAQPVSPDSATGDEPAGKGPDGSGTRRRRPNDPKHHDRGAGTVDR